MSRGEFTYGVGTKYLRTNVRGPPSFGESTYPPRHGAEIRRRDIRTYQVGTEYPVSIYLGWEVLRRYTLGMSSVQSGLDKTRNRRPEISCQIIVPRRLETTCKLETMIITVVFSHIIWIDTCLWKFEIGTKVPRSVSHAPSCGQRLTRLSR